MSSVSSLNIRRRENKAPWRFFSTFLASFCCLFEAISDFPFAFSFQGLSKRRLLLSFKICFGPTPSENTYRKTIQSTLDLLKISHPRRLEFEMKEKRLERNLRKSNFILKWIWSCFVAITRLRFDCYFYSNWTKLMRLEVQFSIQRKFCKQNEIQVNSLSNVSRGDWRLIFGEI